MGGGGGGEDEEEERRRGIERVRKKEREQREKKNIFLRVAKRERETEKVFFFYSDVKIQENPKKMATKEKKFLIYKKEESGKEEVEEVENKRSSRKAFSRL